MAYDIFTIILLSLSGLLLGVEAFAVIVFLKTHNLQPL